MRSFRKLTLSTLVAVYILILVGGIVRSTGSGMGCPDWPRCFGSWVPPTSVEELPANYKEIYSEHRNKKNQKFAKYLTAFGMEDTAAKILNDPNVLEEADFNPVKTLIEYINRIVGVIIGFLIFAVFISSLKFRKFEVRLTIIAFLTFLLVGIQGWIGSVVVSTNLTPWVITVHMFLALVIVALLIYLYHEAGEIYSIKSTIGFWWLLSCIVVLLVQILLGTQVREGIDVVATLLAREQWIENLGQSFRIHRSFSWLVLLLHVGLILRLLKTGGPKVFPLTLILLILGTILTGLGMAFFAVPPFLQPVHLLLATITFGMQFLLLLKVNRKEEPVGI
ncbi:COX15/CtaA family protein [Pseudochryseolinea flava]|uniref:Heme A synthase n=1 Tax=Pseudochryseolinea flava TaxID=2059302 RepID=A0A364XYR9_9BACT|nr:COX15/CtaA family protein [Pseudochryseolinea flava]RAV98579.1 heme A synthase [Pseudochryseolinea flava]